MFIFGITELSETVNFLFIFLLVRLSGKTVISPNWAELFRMMDVKWNGKGYHNLHFISYETCTIYIGTNYTYFLFALCQVRFPPLFMHEIYRNNFIYKCLSHMYTYSS
jgi:hypothetical protein